MRIITPLLARRGANDSAKETAPWLPVIPVARLCI